MPFKIEWGSKEHIALILLAIVGILVVMFIMWLLKRKKKTRNIQSTETEKVIIPLEKRALPYISDVKSDRKYNKK